MRRDTAVSLGRRVPTWRNAAPSAVFSISRTSCFAWGTRQRSSGTTSESRSSISPASVSAFDRRRRRARVVEKGWLDRRSPIRHRADRSRGHVRRLVSEGRAESRDELFCGDLSQNFRAKSPTWPPAHPDRRRASAGLRTTGWAGPDSISWAATVPTNARAASPKSLSGTALTNEAWTPRRASEIATFASAPSKVASRLSSTRTWYPLANRPSATYDPITRPAGNQDVHALSPKTLRNSSILLLESRGTASRTSSSGQFHHWMASSFAIASGENRYLRTFAGQPPTMA